MTPRTASGGIYRCISGGEETSRIEHAIAHAFSRILAMKPPCRTRSTVVDSAMRALVDHMWVRA